MEGLISHLRSKLFIEFFKSPDLKVLVEDHKVEAITRGEGKKDLVWFTKNN